MEGVTYLGQYHSKPLLILGRLCLGMNIRAWYISNKKVLSNTPYIALNIAKMWNPHYRYRNVIKEADTDLTLVWVRKFPRRAAKLNFLQTKPKGCQVQTLINPPKIFKTMVRGRRSRKAAQVAGTSFVSSRDPELMYCNKWDCINTLTYTYILLEGGQELGRSINMDLR